MEWRETGGPDVKAPRKFGYGTSVIKDLISYELDGRTDYEFSGTGVCCRLQISARWVVLAPQPIPNLKSASSAPPRVHFGALNGGAYG
jgi:hypothetical protein